MRWQQVEENGQREHLCATCQRINFELLFRPTMRPVYPTKRDDYIALGPLVDIFQKTYCSFCRLVRQIFLIDAKSKVPKNLDQDASMEHLLRLLVPYLLESIYLNPFLFENFPRLYLSRASDLKPVDVIPYSTADLNNSTELPQRSLGIRLVDRYSGFGRVVLRDRIDFAWVKETLRLCDAKSPKRERTHDFTLRAIDVDEFCLVDVDAAVRYVTLSYTWGEETKQLELTQKNETYFRRPGSLYHNLGLIPRTIQDAIHLTRKIGEKLLWVDSLCIRQDDPVDRERQIDAMGIIYNSSILSIQAACGDDANYGLPGVFPGTREIEQVIERVGSLLISNMLPSKSEVVLTSKWNSRGWTFQERGLARRRILITDRVVFYWCWHNDSPEDEHCSHLNWPEGEDEPQSAFFYDGPHDRLSHYDYSRDTNLDMYAYLVSEYSNRDLGRQEDAARAMSGMSRIIQSHFQGRLLWGLPETEFDAALLWSPIGASTQRRNKTTGFHLFPSWSWLGWTGHAAYPWVIGRMFAFSTLNSPHIWVDMEKNVSFRSERMRIRSHSAAEVEKKWARLEGKWGFLEKGNPNAMPCFQPIEFMDPRPFSYRSKGHSFLKFRSWVAHFVLAGDICEHRERYNIVHKLYYVQLLDTSGCGVGYIDTPGPEFVESDFRAKLGTKQDFVVLSRASLDPWTKEPPGPLPTLGLESESGLGGEMARGDGPGKGKGAGAFKEMEGGRIEEMSKFDIKAYDQTKPWCLFNVMMIREYEGRLALRVAIGRIHVDAFIRAQPVIKTVVLL
jgi:Heterokaryon incompatibility protein (HET)